MVQYMHKLTSYMVLSFFDSVYNSLIHYKAIKYHIIIIIWRGIHQKVSFCFVIFAKEPVRSIPRLFC